MENAKRLPNFRLFRSPRNRAIRELNNIFVQIMKKSEKERESIEAAGFESPFAEITDEDIDSLFSD